MKGTTMPLSPQEAAQSLEDVRQTEQRSAEAYGYQIASNHLILWGLVWLIGYGATDLRPDLANIVWPVLMLLAISASFFMPKSGKRNWRWAALVPIVFVFIAATYAVMWPVSGAQQGAFIPLMVAAIYSGVGLWAGLRYLAIGVALAALTLGGFFFLHMHFLLWMAVVGGGALIVTGLWFRRA
jgi:hypothetical protein